VRRLPPPSEYVNPYGVVLTEFCMPTKTKKSTEDEQILIHKKKNSQGGESFTFRRRSNALDRVCLMFR